MLSENPIKLIRIRPHHIGTFAEYLVNGRMIDESDIGGHNSKFISELRNLYNTIAKDTDSVGILVVNGSKGDSICDLCDTTNCETKKRNDDLNIWNGSGLIMQNSGLEIGQVYSSKEFRNRVKRLYPHNLC